VKALTTSDSFSGICWNQRKTKVDDERAKSISLLFEGFAGKGLQHYRTIQAMPLILGDERKADAAYLDTCRTKRNTVLMVAS